MALAALTAAGAPLEHVSRELDKLGVPFGLRSENVEGSGARALRISVEGAEQRRRTAPRARSSR